MAPRSGMHAPAAPPLPARQRRREALLPTLDRALKVVGPTRHRRRSIAARPGPVTMGPSLSSTATTTPPADSGPSGAARAAGPTCHPPAPPVSPDPPAGSGPLQGIVAPNREVALCGRLATLSGNRGWPREGSAVFGADGATLRRGLIWGRTLNAGPGNARPGTRDTSNCRSPEFESARRVSLFPWWLRRLVSHRGWNRALDDWWMAHCPWCDGYGGQPCDSHFGKDTTSPVRARPATPSREEARQPSPKRKPGRREQPNFQLPKARELP
jgi:hypothetical protein